MVAIVSGNGIGLNLASLAGLGKNNAAMGQSGESAYVNVATGNLVLQRRDDRLEGPRTPIELVRTYNSQGQIHDDNGDNWWINGYRRIVNLTGTANTAGSTVQRIGSDGSALTYRYDSASTSYVPVSESGKHDALTYNQASGEWRWYEVSANQTYQHLNETYEASGSSWRLHSVNYNGPMSNGVAFTYSYDANGLLSQIQDRTGETMEFVYDGTQLMQERVRQADGSYLSRTTYWYDSLNRLSQVVVDLSPSDNDVSDFNIYRTTYDYLGGTNLVSGILQSDGTRLTLSYDDQQRVTVMIDALGRATRFSYDTAHRTTTVTDALGNASVYRYDGQNRLVEATGPQVDGLAQHVTYAYDAAGNLVQTQDAQGNIVTKTYNAHGDVLTEVDGQGNRIERTYDARNQLLTQALYRASDANGLVAPPEVTRYVYNLLGDLIYVVDAEGTVTVNTYSGPSLLVSTHMLATTGKFTQVRYDISALAANQALTVSSISAWVNAQDKSARTLTAYQTNVRGQVVRQTVYAKVDANGAGIADGTESVTQYAYDAFGNLVMQIDPNGNQTSYAYDGLNRLLSTTDALGHTTLNQYDDARHVVRHIQANGRVDADIYDSAGELLSSIAGGQVQASYRYDDLGRLVMSADGTGVKTFYQYDAAGNLRLQIDGAGSVTEYVYNALNQRVQTIRHTQPMPASELAALAARYGSGPDVAAAARVALTEWSAAPQYATPDSATAGAWSTAAQYEEGTVVLYQGQRWEARWWSQGDVPGTASVWRQAPAADGTVPWLARTYSPGTLVSHAGSKWIARGWMDPDEVPGVATSWELVEDGTNATPWVRSRQYAAGDEVLYLGMEWRAQGATQGDTPDDHPALWLNEGTAPATLWQPGGQYLEGARVVHDGQTWEARWWAEGDIPGVDSVWKQVSDGTGTVRWLPQQYSDGTLVTHGGHAWMARSWMDTTEEPGQVADWVLVPDGSTILPWTWATTYRAGDEVIHLGVKWRAQGANTAAAPDDNPSLWVKEEAAPTTPWMAAAQYTEGARVVYGGQTWEARWWAEGDVPGVASVWKQVPGADGTVPWLPAEYPGGTLVTHNGSTWMAQGWMKAGEKPGVATDWILVPPGSTVLPWVRAQTYHAGDEVIDLGVKWRAQATTQGNTPAYDSSGVWANEGPAPATPWLPSAQYTDNARVVYDGKLWEARWWSQSDIPGVDSVWRLLGAAPVQQAASGQQAPAAPAAGPSTWTLYDAAGRLAKSVDALGHVTAYRYDAAGNRIAQIAYATPIDISVLNAGTRAEQVAVTTSADDRATFFYYDGANRPIGQVDPEGYVTRNVYDAAGRLVETVRYANRTGGQPTAAADFATLIPSTSTGDQHTYRLYDGQGRVVGEVDAEGYLTEQQYDAAGNVTASIRYANRVTAAVTAASTLASVRPAASAQDQTTRRVYDALNRLLQSTDAAGTVTQYAYDALGNLIGTAIAAGTAEAATASQRFDALGRLTGSLSGLGSALLAQAQTPDQVQAVWTQYGTAYDYDAAGRRIGSTDPAGNKTLFYYDAAGHLTHTINALGEVRENRYNALGRLEQTVQYGTRLPSLAGLTGGLANTALANAIAAIANGSRDAVTAYAYDAAGNLASQTDALQAVTTFAYDAFGDAITRTQDLGDGRTLVETRSYDKRGLLTGDTLDAGGVNATTVAEYDAFGRAVRTADANGNATRQDYDRLGRLVQTVDPRNAARTTAYDAFDRVLTQTDALGRATSYAYDSAARSMTVTTAEGITVTTVRNRQGQVQSITDGNGNTTAYTYDRDGNLTRTDAPASHTSSVYDAAGRLVETVDANGNRVDYAYDAANRVLTRTVDPAGLNLVTRYAYDALGRRVSVTDPNGSVTATEFDAAGNTLRQTVDAAGQKLATAYTYDKRGRVLTVTSPGGAVIRYAYDKLGRRTEEHVDPDGLDLVTRYEYDDNGNVTARIDPNGHATRFVYDGSNRLVLQADAAGNVSQTSYDDNGRVIQTTRYANPVSLAGLGLQVTASDITARLAVDATRDNTLKTVYDMDGRAVFTVDGTGSVTQRTYDKNSNVVRSVNYANAIPVTTAPTLDAVRAAVDAIKDAVRDALSVNIYDKANHLTAKVDGTGAVTTFAYDANGNVTEQVSYATRIDIKSLLANAANGIITQEGVMARVTADASHDQRVRMSYDAGNRLTVSAAVQDEIGGVLQWSVTKQSYDSDGNVVSSIRYARLVSLGSASALPAAADIAALAVSTPSQDRQVRMVYDTANRLTDTATAQGVDANGVTQWAVAHRVYDSNGNVIANTQYAKLLAVNPPAPEAQADVAAWIQGVTTDAGRDQQARMVYDAANRLTDTATAQGVDANGVTQWAITHRVYDSNGNVVANTQYAKLLAANPPAPDARVDVAAWILGATTDPARDQRTRMVYDTANRLTDTATAQGMDANGAPQWAVAHRVYDSNGNVVANTQYAKLLTSNPPAPDALAATADWIKGVTSDAARDQQIRMVYDADNRLTATATAQGVSAGATQWAVTRQVYDGKGNIIARTRYASLLTANAPAPEALASVAGWIGNVAANSAVDQTSRFAYDAANQQVFSIDAMGTVTQREYDAIGNVIKQTAYAVPVSLTGIPDAATIRQAISHTAQDHVMRTVYDAAGHAVADVDALGHVMERRYDAAGNVTAVIRRQRTIDLDQLDAQADTVRLRSLISADTGDRIERSVFDAAGHVRYAVDTLGYVKQSDVDTFGRIVKTTEYDQSISLAGETLTEGAINGALHRSADKDRVNTFAYDIQGNLLSSTDPMGGQESWTYDAFDRKTTFTNKNGVTWDYDYDPAGRLTLERAPEVAVSSVLNLAKVQGKTVYDVQTGKLRPETRITYDAFGNVSSRTEAANTPDARTTRYEYDAAGRQVKTIFPPVSVYNPATDPLATDDNALRSDGFPISLSTTVTYDALGNAVMNEDVGSNRSYKAYDRLGRVVYEVDAKGNVTGYQRDTFGNVTNLTRYASPLNSALIAANAHPLSVADVEAGLASTDHAQDRTIVTRYDVLGRAIKVIEPHEYAYDSNGAAGNQYMTAGKATETAYNAFGEVVRQSVYGENAQGVRLTQAAETSLYYNRRGEKVAQVVRESATTGYLTRMEYDAAGNLTRQVDYAKSISSWSESDYEAPIANADLDRDTRFAYDRNNRKVAETRVHVEVSKAADGSSIHDDLSTTYGYDAVGNQTRTTDALGNATYTYHDALGRVTAVAGPSSTVQARTLAAALYLSLLNRAPGVNELAHGIEVITGNSDGAANLATELLAKPEGQALYPASLSPSAFITKLYQIAQNRTPDAEGLAFWTNALNSLSRSKIAADIVRIVVNYTGSNPAGRASTQYLNGKLAAALAGIDPAPEQLSPLTEFKLDVYGNVVARTDYARGAAFADEAAYAAVGASGNDRTTATLYDTHGHAAETIDAEGHASFSSYDRFGRVAKQWQTVTSIDADGHEVQQTAFKQMRYDALGQLVEVVEPDTGGNVVRHGTEYDAFGEVVRQTVNGQTVSYADYDRAGRVWRTNAGDGVDKVLLHDVQGNVTAELRSADQALKSNAIAVASEAAGMNGLLRTETRYNLMGRAIEQTSPAQQVANSVATVEAAFVDATVTSRSMNVVVGGNDSGDTRAWQGENKVTLKWMSLAGLGSGDVKVQLDYESNPVVRTDSEGSQVNYTQLVAKQTGSYTKILSAEQAEQGATFSWEDGSPALDRFTRIQVWKKDVSGQWVKVIDQPETGASSPLIRIPAPEDGATGMTFQYRLTGSEQWTPASLANFGDAYVFDTSVLAEGSYDYLVSYQGLADAAPVEHASGTLNAVPAFRRKQIAELYVMLFNRAPDRAGLNFWTSALGKNVSLTHAASELINSEEGRRLFPAGTSNVDFIRKLYTGALGREPDAEGLNYWLSHLSQYPDRGEFAVTLIGAVKTYGGQVQAGLDSQKLFNNKVDVSLAYAVDMGGNSPASGEAILKLVTKNDKTIALQEATKAAATETLQRQITQLYVGLHNRAPDIDGLNYWVGRLQGGTSIGDIAQEMLTSPEGKTVYPAPLDDTQFVTRFYNLALGRNPDAEGLAFWTNAAKSMPRGQLVVEITKALLTYAGNDPAALGSLHLFNNKVAIGLSYAVELKGNDPAVAAALLASVTTAPTADAAADAAALASAALSTQKTQAETSSGITATALTTAATVMPLEQQRTLIAQLYVGLLNRAPDSQGFDFWVKALASGTSIESIANQMLAGEGQAIYSPMWTPEQFITKLYQVALGRNPDAEGLAWWLQNAASQSKGLLAANILKGVAEYTGTDPAGLQSQKLFNNRVAVGLTYALELNGNDIAKARDINGLVTADDMSAANVAALAAATEAAIAAAKATATAIATATASVSAAAGASDVLVSASNAATVAVAATNQLSADARMRLDVTQIYVALLNRAPDLTGLANSVAALSGGSTLGNVAQNLLTFPETQAIYSPGLSNSQFITKLYQVALGRDPDAEGLAYWLDAMSKNNYNKGQVAVEILHGVSNYTGGDLAGLNSKASFSKKVADALTKLISDAAASAVTAADVSAATTAANTAKQVADAAATKAAPNASTVNQTAVQRRLQLTRLYESLFNRAPDLNGLNNRFSQMSSGTDITAIAQSMLQDSEALALYPSSLNNTQFITKFYQVAFGRDPDAEGLGFWTNALNSQNRGTVVTQMIDALVNYTGNDPVPLASQRLFDKKVADGLALVTDAASAAATTASNASSTASSTATDAANKASAAASALSSASQAVSQRYQLARLYTAILNRAPDLDGLNFWSNALSSGTSIDSVANSMLNSSDGQAVYSPSLSNSAFITRFYNVALGRNPDADGLAFWLNASGSMTRGQLMVQMVAAVVNYQGLDPAGAASQKLFDNNVANGLASVSTAANNAASTASTTASNAVTAKNNAYSDLQSASTALSNATAAKNTADAQLATATQQADPAQFILNSSTTYRTQMSQLYMSLLNRAPDLGAMKNGISALSSGTSVGALAQSILASSEAQQYYPSSLSNSGFVTKFYQRALGRDPDQGGLDFWTSALNNGKSRGDLVAEIISIVSTYTGSDPAGIYSKNYLNNRTTNAMNTVNSACNDLINAKNTAVTAANNAASALSTANTNYNNAVNTYNNAVSYADSTATAANTASNVASWISSAKSIANQYYTAATALVTASDAAIAAANAAGIIAASKEFIAATSIAADASYQAAKTYADVLTVLKNTAATTATALNAASTAANTVRDAANQAVSAYNNSVSVASTAAGTSLEARQRTQLAQLYVALLNRSPDLDGFNYWETSLASGVPLVDIAQEFLNSTTGKSLYPASMSNTEFLTKLYNIALNRNPDADGLTFWNKALETRSRAQVAVDVIKALVDYTGIDPLAANSQSYFNHKVANALSAVGADAAAAATPAGAAAATASAIGLAVARTRAAANTADAAATQAIANTPYGQQVLALTKLYVILLGHAPDFDGLNYWVGRMQSGATIVDVATSMLNDTETKKLYPDGLSDAQFISRIYSVQQGRSPDAEGLAYWTDALKTRSRGQVVLDIIDAVINYNGTNVNGLASQNLFQDRVFGALQAVLNQAPAGKTAIHNAAVVAAAAAKAASDIAAKTLVDPATLLNGGFTSAIVGSQQAVAKPVVHRSYDRWGNVLEITDARNPAWKTTYTYNAGNQLTSEHKPGDASGPASNTAFYYDALGRNVAVRDARGYVNGQRYDAQGNVVEELHADGGRVNYTYDLFGDRLQQRVLLKQPLLMTLLQGERVLQTDYGYDHLGHLTGVTHAAVDVYVNNGIYQNKRQLAETYTYDELGRRITATDGAGARTVTAYDLRGNVVRVTDALNHSTYSTYDALNHKNGEVDALGRSMSWQVDVRGRLLAHVDLGGHTMEYQYNNLGQLTVQRDVSGHGQDLRYTYDEAGLLVRIDDNATKQVTTYAYDLAGNRVREKTVAFVPGSQIAVVAQDNHLQYDAQGRLAQIDDGRYHLRYDYDANGNRIHVTSAYFNDAGAEMKKETWNVYDQMNRATIVDGVNHGGTIEIDPGQGHQIVYDYDGSRLSDTYYGKRIITGSAETPPYGFDDAGNLFYGYDANGQEITSPLTIATREVGTGVTTEAYHYDAAGRLTNVYRDDIEVDRRHYDAAGRAVATGLVVGGFANEQSIADKLRELGVAAESRTYGYDAAGQVDFQITYNIKGEPTSDVRYHYDAAGRLTSYSIHVPKGDGTYDDVYTYTYGVAFDSDKVTRIDLHTSNRGDAATTNTYDVNGNLIQVTDTTGLNRTLINDAAGRVLERLQDGKRTHTLIANGEVIGSSDDSFFDSINTAYVPASTGSTAPSSYTVQKNDTLQGIAKAVWGDATLWYLIADANGLDGGTPLAEGQVLNLPARPNAVHNNANTFKPYDASEAVGDTSLNLPMPAGADGCGGMGTIIMIVVAIAATVMTAGAGAILMSGGAEALGAASLGEIAAAGGTALLGGGAATVGVSAAGFISLDIGAGVALGAAAIGGAVGSIASQGAAMAMGMQDSFDWSGVALGAASAAVTAGIGAEFMEAGVLSQAPLDVAGRAALGNVLTQGAAVATGLQKQFNWTSVAASAAGAGMGAAVSGGLQSTEFGNAIGKLGVNAAAGFAGGVTTAALRGGTWSAMQVARDAFGNALGSSIADNLGRGSQQESELTKFRRSEIEAMNAEAQAANNPYSLAYGMQPNVGLKLGGGQGLAVTEDNYGDWFNLTNQTIDAGAGKLRLVDELQGSLKRPWEENEFQQLAAGNGASSLVQKDPRNLVKQANALSFLPQGANYDGSQLKSILADIGAQGGRKDISDLQRSELKAAWRSLYQRGQVDKVLDASFLPSQLVEDGLGAFGGGGSVKMPSMRPSVRLPSTESEFVPITAGTLNRPTWRQSEIDVGAQLQGQGYRPQVSFKDGVEVPYGTKGSVRPEYYKEASSVEVKNYNVETNAGRARLERNVVDQAIQRADNLPPGTVQTLTIDVRGQNVTRAQINQMLMNIETKSGGAISRNNINVLR